MFGPVKYDEVSDVWTCDVDENTVLVAQDIADLRIAMDVVENFRRENAR